MSNEILTTKLFIPASRPGSVPRPGLIERLNAGLYGNLTLLSAPAGFGKTTLVAEWISKSALPVAWLSLDEDDSDPARFLMYVIIALQSIAPGLGASTLNLLQAQPPTIDTLLTPLLNEIANLSQTVVLVLDDYHVLDSPEINAALTFLVDNQPPHIHLVITTREDPRLPLARLRARGQLNELRASDLRFTADEAAAFLNHAMGLALSIEDVAALEARTEGWIAGLQLAALSLREEPDKHQFIQAFNGNHHFVLDYLIEEVLHHQPPNIQDFLLKTSILDRMCAPLCDAMLEDNTHAGADMLEHIRQSNLFLIPLDNERRWYRYHHLFGDLLRKRLGQQSGIDVNNLHIRASDWHAINHFEIDAFQHAAAANDIQRVESIIQGTGVPLYFRGISRPILQWLESLPSDFLNAYPSLWVTYAWALMAAHRNSEIEHKLEAAEATLAGVEEDDNNIRDLYGNIAAIRAMDAAIYYKSDTIISQAQRALDLLHPDNLYCRTAVTRSLAIAYQYRGERRAARDMYQQAIAMSESSDNMFVNILATTGLGIIQLSDNQLYDAADSFQRVFDLVGDPEQPVNCVANLRLALIHYEWNDLVAAQAYGERGVRLAQQIEGIDSAVGGKIFLARLKLAQGNLSDAMAALDDVEDVIRQGNFDQKIPDLAAARIDVYLQTGLHEQAVNLAKAHDLPLSQARVRLADGQPHKALDLVTAYRNQMADKAWHDEHLKAMVLESIARYQIGDVDDAVALVGDALASVASAGFIRTFVDEGQPMQMLLSEAAAGGVLPEYTRRLLVAFHAEPGQPQLVSSQALIEPLSDRELEILSLVADGLSNREICERLFISLSTVKGHNRNIYDKLHVKRRTEAVARARDLGIL